MADIKTISTASPSKERCRLSILCVGDGDLTLSLALIRAHGKDQIDLTASTLLASPDELIATYANSALVLKELNERGVTILFGVDATQLHLTSSFSTAEGIKNRFNWILFSHPHLGLETLRENEAWHAERHYRLLAHYFWSAQQILTKDHHDDYARIYLCLCGRQSQTWRMMEAASDSSLQLLRQFDTVTPLLSLDELPSQSHYAAPRKYRNGKLGSKHYLGKFGYQHRPTYPTSSGSTVNVEHSQHYIFQRKTHDNKDTKAFNSTIATPESQQELVCHVCKATFDSQEELQQHYKTPALPNDSPSTKPAKTATRPEKNAATINTDTPNTVPIEINSNGTIGKSKHAPGPVEWSATVTTDDAGQRLRQVLRNQKSKGLKSKRQAEDRIKYGCVTLNGAVVQDSSRVVHLSDVLEVRQLGTTTAAAVCNQNRRIEVVRQEVDWVVVVKPVGMRTKGSFSEDTLESMLSKQLLNDGNSNTYVSLSKLIKGCGGLCVLQSQQLNESTTTKTSKFAVRHTFTALVYGRVDWKERNIEVSGDGGRRWRSKTATGETSKKRCHDQVENLPDASEAAAHSQSDQQHSHHEPLAAEPQQEDKDELTRDTCEIVHVSCTELTSQSAPALSTLVLTTNVNSQIRVDHLCAALRQLGHGVVNDRFGRGKSSDKTNSTMVEQPLPRSMRNLIKNRLCIGCFAVRVINDKNTDELICVNPPERLSAYYWQQRHDATSNGGGQGTIKKKTSVPSNRRSL